MKIETITVRDKLYHLKRRIKVDSVRDVNEIKENYHYDIVFKKDGFYYFCNTIDDAEIIDFELCSEQEITSLVKPLIQKEKQDIINEINKKHRVNNEMLEYVLSKLKGEQK